MTVPSRAVTLEDGRRVAVPQFAVARRPVAVADFASFAQETAYLTTAERSGEIASFRDHGGAVVGVETPVEQQSVAFVSWDDATAFAGHYGWSLPTEEQWLAASVADWLSEIEEEQYWTDAPVHRLIDIDGPNGRQRLRETIWQWFAVTRDTPSSADGRAAKGTSGSCRDSITTRSSASGLIGNVCGTAAHTPAPPIGTIRGR